MSLNLYAASEQWASRPADERFPSIEAAYAAASELRAMTREKKDVLLSSLRAEADGRELRLVGKANVPAALTFNAFGQLARIVGAPAGYLRELPATLAAQNVNHGLARFNGSADKVNVYALQNGTTTVRALTSDQYERIFHVDVLDRLRSVLEGWVVPPARPAVDGQVARAATEADVLAQSGFGLSVNVGDMIADAGIYLGQGTPELFVFMVNMQNRVADGTAEGLSRGVFISNSEVGDRAFRVTRFLFRHVCGNHIVWDASGVEDIRIVHKGRHAERNAWSGMRATLTAYADEGARETEQKILAARSFSLGATKDAVLDSLFGKRIAARRDLDAAYDLAEINEAVDGAPVTAWGFAQGMTRLSQQSLYADARNTLDRAAARVIEMAF